MVCTKALDVFVRAWVSENLSHRVQALICMAQEDIYRGPHVLDWPTVSYPGFLSATKEISRALSDVPDCAYDSNNAEVYESSADDVQDNPYQLLFIDSRYIVKHIVGKELAQYV
jgi:hypothetical protein